jgi:hypothetical protein
VKIFGIMMFDAEKTEFFLYLPTFEMVVLTNSVQKFCNIMIKNFILNNNKDHFSILKQRWVSLSNIELRKITTLFGSVIETAVHLNLFSCTF